ncbi:MAG: hypothetical protein WC444_00170 [Candidatus Paceibacterota bacterium]
MKLIYYQLGIWIFPENSAAHRRCKAGVIVHLRAELARYDLEYRKMVVERDSYLTSLGPETPKTGPLGLSRPGLRDPDKQLLDPFDMFRPNH